MELKINVFRLVAFAALIITIIIGIFILRHQNNAIRILNGNIRADFNSGAISAVSTSNYALTLNTWYQFTYVFNNTSNNDIISYVNGQYSSTATHSYTSLLNSSTDLYIGTYNDGEFAQYFSGKMGIVRLYSSALSASDVSKNFEANRGLYGI
jgi:hypothetical protein